MSEVKTHAVGDKGSNLSSSSQIKEYYHVMLKVQAIQWTLSKPLSVSFVKQLIGDMADKFEVATLPSGGLIIRGDDEKYTRVLYLKEGDYLVRDSSGITIYPYQEFETKFKRTRTYEEVEAARGWWAKALDRWTIYNTTRGS